MRARILSILNLLICSVLLLGATDRTVPFDSLPKEAKMTIAAIQAGGPFAYKRDGAAFNNREGILPKHSRGYYKEYTVITPGALSRGRRRIIWGQGGEFYYTKNHYRSFELVTDIPPASPTQERQQKKRK